MNKKNILGWGLLFILVLSLIPGALAIPPATVSITGGHSYVIELEGIMDTYRWGGVKFTSAGGSRAESPLPVAYIPLNTPVIYDTPIEIGTFNDDHHYFAAANIDEFDITNLLDVDASDLTSGGLFDAIEFPIFYPDYDVYSDNPENTYCCDQEIVQVGGLNFTAFRITLEPNVDSYLLKYDDEGEERPFFLTKIETTTCFDGDACVAELIMPLQPLGEEYSIFIISDLPQYTYRVWIDGVETNWFEYTGVPHEIEFEVTGLYTGVPEPNADIFVKEKSGYGIFIPQRLSGIVGEGYTVGSTDASGRETFIIAPTEYDELADYELTYGVFFGGAITSEQYLNTTETSIFVEDRKSFPAYPGLDNALKVDVVAMSNINNYLFRWASAELAREFRIDYDVAGDSFTTYEDDSAGAITLSSGAVNLITLRALVGGSSSENYYYRIKESDGYLLLNPHASTATGTKQRVSGEVIQTSETIVICPTTRDPVFGTITFEVLDSSYTVLNSYTATVDETLQTPFGSNSYPDNDLKTFVTTVSQVIGNLYKSTR